MVAAAADEADMVVAAVVVAMVRKDQIVADMPLVAISAVVAAVVAEILVAVAVATVTTVIGTATASVNAIANVAVAGNVTTIDYRCKMIQELGFKAETKLFSGLFVKIWIDRGG